MTYAQKLRELRDAAGLSEMKLATKSGVSYFTLHDYAIGRRRPGFAPAAKIARALEVSCDVFVDCEDVAGPVTSPKRASGRPRKAK